MHFTDSLHVDVGILLLLPVTLPVHENLLGATAHEDVEQKNVVGSLVGAGVGGAAANASQ